VQSRRKKRLDFWIVSVHCEINMHPFFEVGRFPWDRVEAKILHQALFTSIGAAGRIDLIYQACGGVRPLTQPAAADLMWKEALQLLASAGRIKQLCEELARQGEWPALKTAVEAIEAAVDLLDVRVLANDRIFVDRRNLRTEVVKLCGPAASHGVLLVRGDPSAGKSWTKYFIEDLARALGAKCVYLFEGYVSNVDDVLGQLFAAMGEGDAKPVRLESETAFFSRACMKLQEVATVREQELWIVVDDLGEGTEGPHLDRQIRDFFEQFGLAMANPAFARWFRLVLIDYPDGRVPTKWKDVWVEDRAHEGEADDKALAEFLEQWSRRKEKKLVDADKQKFVSDIVATVDAPPPPGVQSPPRMMRLHTALSAALKKL
jgi:hypothetical protein